MTLSYSFYILSTLIDLLEAPGSFIMGCDSKHTIQVKSLLAAQDEVSLKIGKTPRKPPAGVPLANT